MSEPVNRYHFTRPLIINKWLGAVAATRAEGQPWIRAMEVGRLRDAREACGHSTLHIATHPAVKSLVSIDINPETEIVCRAFLPDIALARTTFVNGDAIAWLSDKAAHNDADFDFIYLDGLNDAAFCRDVLVASLGVAHAGTVILLDDTDGPAGVDKGVAAKPYILEHAHLFAVLDDVPRDATCHGQMAIRVEG